MLNNIIFSPDSPVLQAAALRPRVQPLYDRQAYGTAQSTPITFFQTPQGQATLGAWTTNMRLAGTLPQPNIAEVHAIYVEPLMRAPVGTTGYTYTDAADFQRIVQNSQFQFIVGTSNRPVVEGPAEFFPAPWGISIGGTGLTTVLAAGNGIKDFRSYFGISAFPELLTPSEAFNCIIAPANGGAMSAYVTATSNTVDIRVVLGCLYGQGI